jgi:hypothetical protein
VALGQAKKIIKINLNIWQHDLYLQTGRPEK